MQETQNQLTALLESEAAKAMLETGEERGWIELALDAISDAAAYVGNARLDILAENHLGRALFPQLYADPTRPANHARFVFLDPEAEGFYGDWDRAASGAWQFCAGQPGATRTTASSPTSSASSKPAAKHSVPTGPPTTCASTTPASSTSITQSSASSA
jgi:transcription regulator MmyB-like protein